MEFQEMLRKLRKEAGLTQEELAEKAGIPTGTLRNHEQGIRQPGWDVVMRLAKALQVSADVFAECDEVNTAKPKSKSPAPKKPAAKKGKK